MAISDGVFDEGTFDNATFNNVSRNESASLTDFSSSSAELFKANNESVTVNDSDIKQVGKVVQQALAVGDGFSREVDYSRTFSDSFDLVDAESFVQFKQFQESTGLTDSESKFVGKSLTDPVNLNDNYIDEVQFFRRLTQTFSLDTEREEFFELVLSENTAVSDASRFNLARTTSESLTVQDELVREVQFDRGLAENLVLNDDVSTLISQLVILAETVGITENSSTESEFFREVADSTSVTDSTSSQFFKTVADSFGLNDDSSKSLLKRLSQSTTVSDSDVEFLLRTAFSESVTLRGNVSKVAELFRRYAEDFDVTDADIKQVGKKLEEGFSSGDNVSSSADLFRELADSVVLADEPRKAFFTAVSETVLVSDSVSREASLFRTVSDSFGLNDFEKYLLAKTVLQQATVNTGFSRVIEFERVFSGSFGVDDSASKFLAKSIRDSFGLNDSVETEGEFKRSISQLATVSANLAKELDRSVSESFDLSDEQTKQVGKVLSDSVSLSDAALDYKFRVDDFPDVVEIFKSSKVEVDLEKL